MSTKIFLHEALQVGPWRIARKHLLFIIAFSLLVIISGIVVIQTHKFDANYDDDDDDHDDEDDDDADDDDDEYKRNLGSGDWLLIVIVAISAVLAVIATIVCFFAKKNAPVQMPNPPKDPVYTVQYNKDLKTAINSIPRASYTVPQPITVWSGPPPQPQLAAANPQPNAVQYPNLQAQGLQNTAPQENQRKRPRLQNPSAPELPPPYSP